jgi:hypothetical protein
MEFEAYRYNRLTSSLNFIGKYVCDMKPAIPPLNIHPHIEYYEGILKTISGYRIGVMSMTYVSKFLRRAVVEIDKVGDSEWPIDNGGPGSCVWGTENWGTVFARAGWDVRVEQSDGNVTEVSGESWSKSELHNAMLNWRESSDLDNQWRYHLICVRQLDMTSRGIMYDAYGSDSNNIPREGAAIASHWVFPNNDPKWGQCRGLRFGATTAPYFRTAVHEIAHAILLYHPDDPNENYIMQVTPQIASNAAVNEFPCNIDWAFSPSDERLLKHLPDIAVRPGGIPFGVSHSTFLLDYDRIVEEPEGLSLDVTPFLKAVPFGAPVRVSIELTNELKEPIPAPKTLSMTTGYIQGHVIDPAGVSRPYSTIIRELDTQDLAPLASGASISSDMTLLRGSKGPLFPSPGTHIINVNVTWNLYNVLVRVTGESQVAIMPPEDETHAETALNLLSTPDTLLALAIGGDHITNGYKAIQSALDVPALKPHYSYIEAKRIGRKFMERKPDLTSVSKLIDEETVMTGYEIKRTAQMVQTTEGPKRAINKIIKILKTKANKVPEKDDIMKLLDSLS